MCFIGGSGNYYATKIVVVDKLQRIVTIFHLVSNTVTIMQQFPIGAKNIGQIFFATSITIYSILFHIIKLGGSCSVAVNKVH